MPVEEIIKEYDKNEKEILALIGRQSALIEKIRNANKDEYEWISVKEASSMLGISKDVIYAKINTGKLNAKFIGTKRFVKKSECVKINDRG